MNEFVAPLKRVFAILIVISATQSCCANESGLLKQFLSNHCVDCHDQQTQKGGVDLQNLEYKLEDPDLHRIWTRIYDQVKNGQMPPKGSARPNAGTIRKFTDELSKQLVQADLPRRHSVLRRLNRIEYENTVNDLFQIRLSLKEMLPEDAVVAGFDTVSEGLQLSSEQMEIYLDAADRVVSHVLKYTAEPKKVSMKMPLGLDPISSTGIGVYFVKTEDNSLVIFQSNYVPAGAFSGKATADGTYRVKVNAKTYQTNKTIVMAVYVGDYLVDRIINLIGFHDILPGEEWNTVEFESFLKKGESFQMVPYRFRPVGSGKELFNGPGLMIGEVSVEGPLEPWPPLCRKLLLGEIDPKKGSLNDAKEIVSRFLPRAFRRSVDSTEVEPYVDLVESVLNSGRSFEEALSVGLKAVLCSPEFLMREEQFTAENATNGTSIPSRISDATFASRLSYFLWNSMPDEELLTLAAEQKLNSPSMIPRQIERMLNDPKADRFVENFTGQWLGLRNIDFTVPDAKLYPEYDEMLRYSILEETRRYFREILDQNLSVLDFVDSDWAILNSRLALQYGIKGVDSSKFRRVTLPPDSVRGGILTQASVLKVLANGTTTSPVVRGTWILENILGKPTLPPPANVSSIEPDLRGATTVREQMQKHRSVESCAACHRRIDPPGFVLENFDPIGGWRKYYRTLTVGQPVKLKINGSMAEFRTGRLIKSNETMSDGRVVLDVRGLKKILSEDKHAIAHCLTEKLLTYGLGREIGFSDRSEIRAIVSKIEPKKFGFRSLIHEIAHSPIFQNH